MTVIRIPVAPPSTTGSRDATIDAVRAISLLFVVVLHALMVGAWIGPDGSLLTKVALTGEPWFAPATWAVQVMPLFFIAGGFVSLQQWRRLRGRGAGVGEYVTGRVRRLAVPTAVMLGAVGAALVLARSLGADVSLIAEASLRIGQPLWFLAVYIGVTTLVPAMAWLHERASRLTLVGLAAGALAIDIASRESGFALGYVNLAFVWLLMQQLGFVMLDGRLNAWPGRRLFAGMGAALALLLLCLFLGWSPDMIENLNPPTVALVLLGVAQFFALQLARPWLDRITGRPRVAGMTARAGEGAMSVYLWHMPMIMLLVAVMWGLGLPMPEPHTAAWWATRLPWLVTVFTIVLPAAAVVAGFDRPLMRWADRLAAHPLVAAVPDGIRALLAALLATAGTTVALLIGLDGWLPAALAVGFLLTAVVLSSARAGEGAARRRDADE